MFISLDPNLRQAAFDKMCEHLASGGRIVVGSNDPIGINAVIGKSSSGQTLTVLARSDRAAFEKYMPVLGSTPERLAEYFSRYRAAFYYELEMWDGVLDGPGGSLGFRIRQGR